MEADYEAVIPSKDALPTSRLAQLEVVRVRLIGPRRAHRVGPD